MRIVHFIYDHPNNPWLGGGGAVRALEINKRLVQKGHEILVISGGFPGCQKYSKLNGIRFSFSSSVNSYPMSRLLYSIEARKIFKKVASKSTVDLVIDDTSAFSYTMPWRVWNGPIIGIVHHVVGLKHAKGKFGHLGSIIAFLERANLKKHEKMIVVSGGTQKALIEMGINPQQICIIENGISSPGFTKKPSVTLPSKYMLFLGRIEIYNKGLDRLLDLFREAACHFDDLNLMVAGSGKDNNLFKKLVVKHPFRDRILVLGFVNDDLKDYLLNKASVVCMLSRYEGWGIVAIEAAARGTPVLATRISGLQEAVDDGVTGLLCSEDGQFFPSLKFILENSELKDACRNRADLYRKKFEWEAVSDKTAHVYMESLG